MKIYSKFMDISGIANTFTSFFSTPQEVNSLESSKSNPDLANPMLVLLFVKFVKDYYTFMINLSYIGILSLKTSSSLKTK